MKRKSKKPKSKTKPTLHDPALLKLKRRRHMFVLRIPAPIQMTDPVTDEPAVEPVYITNDEGERVPKTMRIGDQIVIVHRDQPPWTLWAFVARMILTGKNFGTGKDAARNGRCLRNAIKGKSHKERHVEGLPPGCILIDEAAIEAVRRVMPSADHWLNQASYQLEPFMLAFDEAKSLEDWKREQEEKPEGIDDDFTRTATSSAA